MSEDSEQSSNIAKQILVPANSCNLEEATTGTPKQPAAAVPVQKISYGPQIAKVLINDEWVDIQIIGQNDHPVVAEAVHLTVEPTAELWNSESTILLINEYKDKKPLVDSGKVSSLNKMWNLIGDEFHKRGYRQTSKQCEYKWRSLLRTYKKSNQNVHLGWKKKFDQYEMLLDQVLGSGIELDQTPVKQENCDSSDSEVEVASVSKTPSSVRRLEHTPRTVEALADLSGDESETAGKTRKSTRNDTLSEVRKFRRVMLRLAKRREAARQRRHTEKMQLLKELLIETMCR